MKVFKDTTKAKVVVGFGIAISIVAFATYLTYSSFTQLLLSVKVLSRPNNKLVKLQHTLSDITTAESSIRTYTLTTEDQHFDSYLNDLHMVHRQIDTLRILMAGNRTELLQVDSISALLEEKKLSLEKYVDLKKERRSYNYSGKAMEQIASAATTPPVAKTPRTPIRKASVTSQPKKNTPTPPQEESKPNFLQKLFSRKREPEPAPAQATVKKQKPIKPKPKPKAAAPVNLTEVADVERILSDVQREVNQYEDMLVLKEMELLQQDKLIMDRIRGMIYRLEQHEREKAASNSANAQEVAQNTSLVLLIIGILGLLSCIAFILLILRDITRNNRYRSLLIRARKEAVQLARTKEAFVANMSHEIRTPLNVVLGFSEQLQHTPLLKQQQEHLQAIQSAGEHLLRIVNDVLDLSKIEAGKLHIDKVTFNLHTLLREVEQAFTLKAKAKGIKLSCAADERLSQPLLGDPLRLKQVLFNLADNAIKFTQAGQVSIYASPQAERRGQVEVKIEVSDTGIGISEEQLERVFGEFNQADDSIVRKYGGTGLGLSISKRIVEMQQGSISLRSTPGQGSTFTVLLPMQRAKTVAAAPVAQEEKVPQAQDLRGKSVLLIDDDAFSRSLCEMMLQRWGMHVTLAIDGQEALQAVNQQAFDLILTDIQLPGMSGKAVAREIRKKNALVPIVAVTADILSNSNYFSTTGITDFLLKPFSEQELYQKVTQALKTAESKTNGESAVVAVPSPTVPQRPLYDLTEIRRFAGNSNEALAAILEVLVSDHRQNMQLVVKAVEARQWQMLGSLAHRMLTAFKHLKAQAVAEALEELERLLHQPDVADVEHLERVVAKLQTDVQLVLEDLEVKIAHFRTVERALA